MPWVGWCLTGRPTPVALMKVGEAFFCRIVGLKLATRRPRVAPDVEMRDGDVKLCTAEVLADFLRQAQRGGRAAGAKNRKSGTTGRARWILMGHFIASFTVEISSSLSFNSSLCPDICTPRFRPSVVTMVRKLKHHEEKLLKKTDFITYKQDNGHRDHNVIRRMANFWRFRLFLSHADLPQGI